MDTLITIIIAGISGSGFSIIIEKLLEIWKEKIARKAELEKHDREQVEAYEAEYLAEKKKVYIEALQWLGDLRGGFDVIRSPLGRLDKETEEKIAKLNDSVSLMTARLRLYSSDEIYNLFWQLAHYNIFAYYSKWHIAGDGKEIFSQSTTTLARLMQVDLGFRSFVSEPEKIKCPNCGYEHDAYKTCEKCGWTCSKAFAELSRRQQEQIQKWLQVQQAQQTQQVSTLGNS